MTACIMVQIPILKELSLMGKEYSKGIVFCMHVIKAYGEGEV
jgi:hypothetical protein